MYNKVSTIINNQQFSIESGHIARQANGSALLSYGDTVVLVTVVADWSLRDNIDFLPLTVDYQELAYAAGRIPGNFFRREIGRPSEREILISRLIDRPLRPRITKDWKYETQIIINVYSVDKVNDPDVVGLTSASTALMLSDVPFNGPIAGVRVGRVDGRLIINPTTKQRAISDIDLIVAGSHDAVIMVDGKANLVNEDDILESIWFGHTGLQPLLKLQDELANKIGKKKRSFTPPIIDNEFIIKIRELSINELKNIMTIPEKLIRYNKIRQLKTDIINLLGEKGLSYANEIKKIIDDLESEILRNMILTKNRRIDGRNLTEVRPIQCKVGVLPRTHGSALFTRGETQALVTATLGTSGDEQRIESVIEGDIYRHFLLHYNFPPFCVNEVKKLSGPSRREIGHGALARRSIESVLASKEKFPYSIRVVSEILESNGSSSMASVCGASLALMDAGVPITQPVAGVAMGLIIEKDNIAILTDILSDEDHLGDMDFKITGTDIGIAAIQMDIKINGITKNIMKKALKQAKIGRLHILNEMAKTINHPRDEISMHAPRIATIKIPIEKIKDLIGPGGKIIRSIQIESGAKIDVENDGTVHVVAVDSDISLYALRMIRDLIQEPEKGGIYEGKVVRIMDFGAFIEIMPGRDGLLHISEIDHTRVRAVTDILKEGEIIKVKILDIDDRGKIRLSRKALLPPISSIEKK